MANKTIHKARARTANKNTKPESHIHVFQLNNYVKPVIKEEMGKDWVLNGKNNSFFKDIIECYNGSPTNAAIINGYSELIYGKGLTLKGEDKSVLGLFPKKEVRRIVSDFKLYGSASFQVVFSKGKGALRKVTGVYHIPRETIAPNKMDEDGEIETYWYCKDWSNTTKNKPIPYPAFGTSKEDIEIYVIEPYKAGKYYYADPDYLAGLQYAKLEEEISNYFINHIQNGFSAGFVINLNNGIPEKEVQDEMERAIKQKTTGSNAAGNVVISFNNSTDTKTTVEAFPTNTSHKNWESLTGEARTQLFVAHRVTSPMLFGIKDKTGLGNNAEELETASKLLYGTVISPMQEEILDAFQEVIMFNGVEAELEFKPLINFTKEDGTTTNVGENVELKKKSDSDLDVFTANALIEQGEDESAMEGYTLIHESKVEGIPEDTFESHLASVVTGSPNTKSEQDNVLFRVRYVYSPQSISDNSREFCKKMVQANKVYRKEDIVEAEQNVVNAGFGAGGSDNYSIWLYKGGVNCKHFWQRRVYLKTNNSIISVSEARRKILELDPEQRNAVRLPVNEKEVAQSASESNNHWKLN
jgi:hypothetical protein